MEDLLNRFFLSDFIDEEIYIFNSVESPVNSPQPETGVEELAGTYGTELSYFGKNENGILILTNEPNDQWIIPKEKMVLKTILEALPQKPVLEESALVNLSVLKQSGISEFSSFFQPVQIIGFGIPDEFELSIERNIVVEADNTLCYITPDTLTEIAMSREKKISLWKNFKTLFLIS